MGSTVKDRGRIFSWIGPSQAAPGRSTTAGFLLLALLSCGGEDATAPPPPPPPPESPRATRITIEPDRVVLVTGDTVRLTGSVLDQHEMVIPDAALTWASTDPAVATVDASGLVTGVTVGRTSITAASGEVSASSAATVQSVEMATLMDLHESTGGADWTNRENWGGEEPVGSWYGVEVNEGGRVTALRLSENGLGGQLPENLGDLAFLTELHVDGNEGLSGPIPVSLSALSIQQLQYGGTMLCTVRDEAFQEWLNAIPTRGGEFIACSEERSHLMALYDAMGGESWTNEDNWGTDAPLEDWHGITVNSNGRVTEIFLHSNNLTGEISPEIGHFPELRNLNLGRNQLRGEIPPEIGLLTELRELGLQDLNDLTGSIPAEIGNLANLEELWLYDTGLTGAIPPELGNLASLRLLILHGSRFSGPIPEELGRLTELEQFWLWNNMIDGPLPASLGGLENLRVLVLGNNRLTGPIPAELGQLGSLQTLELDDNMLDGSLPPEFGDLVALRSLHVRYNPDLSGPLPDELTALAALEDLQAGGTGLCAPTDPEFRAWLNEVVTKWRVRSCGTESHAEAHLIQATQSPEFPVPLVAGRSALLRVFVMSEAETMATIPPVRATFFMDGAEVHSVDIPAGTSAIPTEVQVGELDLSANAEIPGEVIQPGLEMVVEVDPDGTVDPALGVAKRIPAEGRAAVEVQEVPPLYLTLVPFVSTADGNQGAVTFVDSATPDHELLFETRTLLPVGAFEITRHPSVTVSSNDILNMLDHMEQIRTMENGTGHWMGLTPNPADGQGISYLGSDGPNLGKVSVSNLSAGTIAHELGHNLNLTHAPCGGAAGVDWTFPYADARTGVWGYDPRDGGSMVPPDRADLMSYCEPVWISDYYFTNALRFRLVDSAEVWPVASRALMVSGAAAADGTLRLEPAFVVETTPVVPTQGGPYQLTGRRADGSELFSLSFAMQEVMDGDGRFRFTFALPVRAEWESELASLALAGPGGAVEMREGSEPPTVIMRDPVTGQVRAILRDLPAGDLSAGALDALAPEPGLEIMVSGGLPAAADWKR